ncbi:MAG: PCMD domain-containing protein, partial [Odoribacter sp.]|nr:PCMD domain-containing protein [Odoribacter sp.]
MTPGELYLGNYDGTTHTPLYGYPFASRPSQISFWYKYTPKNSADWFEVEIVLKDVAGNIVTSKKITKSGTVSIYQQEKIRLEYEQMTKVASMYILFKSSGNQACLEANENNLTPPPAWNLGNGEYVGSQLYIDDV